ncbi:MAG TPA: LytTR family transcriptional regulator DNA-binding domain-containing protein [Gaiella sp.]|nr:LytTR family transcriptional regulator DNA-binding domain-containing protein [Gaiella sp.]
MSGSRSGKLEPAERRAARAWESFAAGESVVEGVRPQIVDSWARCRDDFGIEPTRDRALPADPDPALAPEESVVAAELGAAAMSIAPELAELGGLVVVADGRGRMLSAWGDEAAERRGKEQNLGPLYSWAEASTGTTGVGTALLTPGAVAVRRFEHWCAAFHDWSCAAVAVRAADGQPVGVVGISVWGRPLPDRAGAWLSGAASGVERRLRRRADLRPRSTTASPALPLVPGRIVGQRAGRTIVVPVDSVHVVELEDGLVWLGTAEGRLRASVRGLDALEARLAPAGFLRVSRTALVNLHRVHEIAPAFKGGVWVVTDGGAAVAVSRRRVPALRAALGL